LKRYLLRWCYRYHDGKPDKRGQWLNGVEGEAARITRENLLVAVIEAKDWETRDVFPLYECPGQDFVLFQWLATQRIRMGGPICYGEGAVVGLRILARNEIVDVFTNGEIVKKPTNHDYDFASLRK
jgi:hypothetical protein